MRNEPPFMSLVAELGGLKKERFAIDMLRLTAP